MGNSLHELMFFISVIRSVCLSNGSDIIGGQ